MASEIASTAMVFPPPGQSVGVVIPTWNAERHWPALDAALRAQDIPPSDVLVIDSSSKDRTRRLAESSGFRVGCIPVSEFGHGRTRQLACNLLPDKDFLLFLTQDAIPATSTAFHTLHRAMTDQAVGAAYGRQLPRPEADAIERHAREFNYPATSSVHTLESRTTLGIKAAFLSNSFALYRRAALEGVGGFPEHVIFGEDSYVAAKMLLAGWKVAYKADAEVVHSHDFTVLEEFRRYFDIGVHHQREGWLIQEFGTAGGEGLRFVKSELRTLLQKRPSLIPLALLRTAAKLLAYRVGRLSSHLPLRVNRLLSSNRGFWPGQ